MIRRRLPQGASFICLDCDAAVFDMGRSWCPLPPLCQCCRYIRDADCTDAERAELRRVLVPEFD